MPAFGLRADQIEQTHAALQVDHADRRFVEQQNFGLVDDAAGEVQAPPHASAELLYGFAGAVGEAGEREHFLNPLAEQGIAHTLRATPVIEIFEGRKVVVERNFLGTPRRARAGQRCPRTLRRGP